MMVIVENEPCLHFGAFYSGRSLATVIRLYNPSHSDSAIVKVDFNTHNDKFVPSEMEKQYEVTLEGRKKEISNSQLTFNCWALEEPGSRALVKELNLSIPP